MGSNNGSWTGRDPRLRLLRTVAGIVLLVLLVYVVVVDQTPDVATLGSLIGALLVVLGFEVGLRWKKDE